MQKIVAQIGGLDVGVCTSEENCKEKAGFLFETKRVNFLKSEVLFRGLM